MQTISKTDYHQNSGCHCCPSFPFYTLCYKIVSNKIDESLLNRFSNSPIISKIIVGRLIRIATFYRLDYFFVFFSLGFTENRSNHLNLKSIG